MPHAKNYFVYILASRRNGTLYTGITSNLLRPVSQHRNDTIDGFTKRYGVHRLCLVRSPSRC
ncbi:MAG TPA: GIY-YIG nuclease family protein [Rhizomicrobium sp.]|nr:GIY-YIG nuclease family protein [Rhizomicrobium sp.]